MRPIAQRTAKKIALLGPRTEHRPGDFGIVVDTREQTPFEFPSVVPIEVKKLDAGDYSVIGYEDKISIERKSEDDFVQSITRDYVRFEAELERLEKYAFCAIVVESTLGRINTHAYTAPGVDPKTVITRAALICVRGVPVFFAGPHRALSMGWTLRLLKFWWRRRRDAEREALFQPKAVDE